MRALAVLCAASLLAGCTIFGVDIAPPGAFNNINALVEELDIASVGEMTYEGRYGTVGNYYPTYVAVIEGDDAVAVLQDRLFAAGFDSFGEFDVDGQQIWQRGLYTDDFIEARLWVRKAGDGINVGNSNLQLEAPSVAVYINE
jgi:hypothetical protein